MRDHCPWLQTFLTLLLLCLILSSKGAGQTCGRPRITIQPKSQLVLAGTDAIFRVGVLDEGCAFTYAWRYFGFNILGATNPTLVLPNVLPPPAGKVGPYSVMVSDVAGSVVSTVAYLTIATGPIPSAASVPVGGQVSFTNFVYGDAGAGPVTNQWYFRGEAIPDATNFVLVLTNIQPWQAGNYFAMISNAAGWLVTSNALLEVAPKPPRLWGTRWVQEALVFQVTGAPEAPYQIQAAPDRMEWTELLTTNAPSSGTFEFIDPDASRFPCRYYRAVQPQTFLPPSR